MRRRSKLLAVVTKASLLLLCFLSNTAAAAQDSLGYTLTPGGLQAIVRAYHPVVRIAGLRAEHASAAALQARGAFDPTVNAALDRKSFDGKLYYSYLGGELSIPSWYGLEFKAGTEELVGDRLNPERTFGTTSYAGVKWNATGVILDTRRAVLRQARALEQASIADRRAAANDVLFDALATYWDWVQSYATVQVLQEAMRVSEERLRFVRAEYVGGLRPAIDTTEALAQLQSFTTSFEAAMVDWQNSGLRLSTFLWNENSEPSSWSTAIVPDAVSLSLLATETSLPPLEELLSTARQSHPKLQSVTAKISVLQTDQLLKQQYLLPKVSLYAGALTPGYYRISESTAPMLQNNHKVSVDVSIPLLLREARGAFRAAGLKLDEANTTRDQLALDIEVKIRSYYNETLGLQRQINAAKSAFESYTRMFTGERIRYEGGESTLFLINARENRVLDAQQKLIELRAKWQKSLAGVLWAAGLLG